MTKGPRWAVWVHSEPSPCVRSTNHQEPSGSHGLVAEAAVPGRSAVASGSSARSSVHTMENPATPAGGVHRTSMMWLVEAVPKTWLGLLRSEGS
jgi:hypothetical protein